MRYILSVVIVLMALGCQHVPPAEEALAKALMDFGHPDDLPGPILFDEPIITDEIIPDPKRVHPDDLPIGEVLPLLLSEYIGMRTPFKWGGVILEIRR